MRHHFVIGPLCDSELFRRKARLYYCVRCRWSFLVCGSKLVVLDQGGNPVAGDESLRRFATFAEGPCPVLEAFASASSAEAAAAGAVLDSKRDPAQVRQHVMHLAGRLPRDGIFTPASANPRHGSRRAGQGIWFSIR